MSLWPCPFILWRSSWYSRTPKSHPILQLFSKHRFWSLIMTIWPAEAPRPVMSEQQNWDDINPTRNTHPQYSQYQHEIHIQRDDQAFPWKMTTNHTTKLMTTDHYQVSLLCLPSDPGIEFSKVITHIRKSFLKLPFLKGKSVVEFLYHDLVGVSVPLVLFQIRWCAIHGWHVNQ